MKVKFQYQLEDEGEMKIMIYRLNFQAFFNRKKLIICACAQRLLP